MSSFATAVAPISTERLYLCDTSLLEYEGAKLLYMAPAPSSPNSVILVFDSTIFHPKGGGQPSDKGLIILDGKHEFTVEAVQSTVSASGPSSTSTIIEHIARLPIDSTDGEHSHDCAFYQGLYNNTSTTSTTSSTSTSSTQPRVLMKVDEELRTKHATLHSGGHALDAALLRVDPTYSAKLRATKGYHFLDGPNVEYDVINGAKLSPEELSALPEKLNDCLRDIVAEDITTIVSVLSKDEAVDAGVLPAGTFDLTHYPETIRVVNLAGFAIPCGGTHVKSTRDLGCLHVTKAKVKKNVLKISYDFKK